MKNSMRFLIALLLLGSLWISISESRGQERELPLEKILNPLPEFDPFEKPPAPPQYFPDEIDKRAREVLIDALTQSKEPLEDHLKFFKAQDAQLQKQHGAATGLSEGVQDLINNTIQDRQRYLAAQKQALKNASSSERKKYLESIINNDDLNQASTIKVAASTITSWLWPNCTWPRGNRTWPTPPSRGWWSGCQRTWITSAPPRRRL